MTWQDWLPEDNVTVIIFNGVIFVMGESYFLIFYQKLVLYSFDWVIMADFSINKKDFEAGKLNVYCEITKQFHEIPQS